MKIDAQHDFGTRECPRCACEVPAKSTRCPICGYAFPARAGLQRGLPWIVAGLLALLLLPLLLSLAAR